MDEIKDPILEEKGISSEGYESRFSSISKRDLKIVGGYLEIIRRVKSVKGKRVPIDKILENTRSFFVDDILRARDTFWMEHCAMSLRALIEDLQIPEDFLVALQCLPDRLQKDGTEFQQYKRIRDFEDFFNDKVHFKDGGKLQKAKDILNNQQIRSINDDIFETICAKFIEELYNLFETYCMKNNRPSQ